MICEEYVEWIRRRNFDYDGVKLFIHGGTCLASDDIGKVFIAADFPFYDYNDGIGEETPFTKRDKHIAVEAWATYDKSDDGLAICEYVFPLTGVFGIHPRYATEEERGTILKCFADWTSPD